MMFLASARNCVKQPPPLAPISAAEITTARPMPAWPPMAPTSTRAYAHAPCAEHGMVGPAAKDFDTTNMNPCAIAGPARLTDYTTDARKVKLADRASDS